MVVTMLILFVCAESCAESPTFNTVQNPEKNPNCVRDNQLMDNSDCFAWDPYDVGHSMQLIENASNIGLKNNYAWYFVTYKFTGTINENTLGTNYKKVKRIYSVIDMEQPYYAYQMNNDLTWNLFEGKFIDYYVDGKLMKDFNGRNLHEYDSKSEILKSSNT